MAQRAKSRDRFTVGLPTFTGRRIIHCELSSSYVQVVHVTCRQRDPDLRMCDLIANEMTKANNQFDICITESNVPQESSSK